MKSPRRASMSFLRIGAHYDPENVGSAAPDSRSMMWSGANLRALASIRTEPAEIVYAFVQVTGEPTEADFAVLDHSELRRAARFVHSADRDRFVLAHAALRSFLARCLDVELSLVRYEE